ncbi:MAG: hypothetical protein MUF31_17310 [Akkermansiaceae bacterium]|jgi:predicted RNA-binding Zn-ribbon protein involved in translation (DUF1610 family)|nr:hypothetical protein [Akkermansiaceae bacterium]
MGPYVVLGGNGLGKTTLMQSVVFALAGGLDESIEEQKALRWSHSYFKGRLSNESLSKARIEVTFRLGATSISVRRGVRSSAVLGVQVDKGEWVEKDTEELFAQILQSAGGYENTSDFAFVVHRLLYLPESRRLLAWDTDAQIRLLMLLNQDVGSESTFRMQRARLKNLDSQKRHAHVALTKAEEELANLLAFDEEDALEEEGVEVPEATKDPMESLPVLVRELGEISRVRFDAERRREEALAKLSRVSATMDGLRSQVENTEAKLISGFLKQIEKDHGLALGKLVSHMVCPACGQKHIDLGLRARQYIREQCCVLCGQEDAYDECGVVLDEAREMLEDLLRQQQAFEEIVRLTEAEWQASRNKEIELQNRVNTLRYQTSMVSFVERELPDKTVEGLKKLKAKLAALEADTEVQLKELKEKLDKDYSAFRKKIEPRLAYLRESYASYARSFLGLPCELEEIDQLGMLNLKLYVPSFNGIVRHHKEACSEAQRFFLDIAFRMALIDTVCEADHAATFLCETPETALDFSYIDNVVEMFTKFSSKTRNILLTANIQKEGIAQEITKRITKNVRAKHIVNLLDYGQLSEVQESSIKKFRSIITKMHSAEHISSKR